MSDLKVVFLFFLLYNSEAREREKDFLENNNLHTFRPVFINMSSYMIYCVIGWKYKFMSPARNQN